MRVLGLDISSAIIGVSIIESDDGRTVQRLLLEHIDLTKYRDLWEKIDRVKEYVASSKARPEFMGLDRIGIEEALLGFRPGLSSAMTIMMLIRMNVVTSHIFREAYGITPQLIPAPTARKTCGVKTVQKKKCGKDIKDQVFEHMCQYDLNDVMWPRKKPTEKNPNPDVKDFCKDQCDAYVVSKACLLLNI